MAKTKSFFFEHKITTIRIFFPIIKIQLIRYVYEIRVYVVCARSVAKIIVVKSFSGKLIVARVMIFRMEKKENICLFFF